MKNILVPVDYSDAAKNAFFYALDFAKQLQADHIILYNAFQPPVPVDTMTTSIDGSFNNLALYDVTTLAENNKVHLENLKAEISATYKGDITIESFSEYNTLRDGIAELCRSKDIALIIMGITGGDGLTEALAGSNSLDIAKHITTPVLIVPHSSGYKTIQQILFTCDYKNVTSTVPVALLKSILAATNAHLHVLHVDAGGETDGHRQQSAILQNLLHNVAVDYHTLEHADFKETVNAFAAHYNIDLLVAIPKKHRFFEGLFHYSHTKTLAFNSHIPLLLMHEEV